MELRIDKNGKITIPKIYGDEYISSIRNGVVDVVDPNAEETKPNQIISYRILGTKKVRPITARLGRYTYALDDSFKIISNGFIFDMTYGEQTSEAVVLELPPIPKTYFIKTSDMVDLILQAQISTYVEVANHPTYFFVSSDEENYYLDFKIYSGGTFREMYGVNYDLGLSEIPSEEQNSLPLSGQETIFTATEIEITINGTKFVTKVEDKTETYGSGKHPFSLSGSEILQDTNTTEGVSSTRSIANNILSQYRNGKETAVLLCDISDYYEYDPTADNGRGQKLISIATSNRMTFEEGDEVIPMIFGANGKDKPMSLKKDGTPKVFRVVGVHIFYDGAVWQEISLQEI